MSKEQLACGVERAKQLVDRLLRRRDRHLRDQASFDATIEGNGGEHYSWANLVVQFSLHCTCCAITHAIRPQKARPCFHLSFESAQVVEASEVPRLTCWL